MADSLLEAPPFLEDVAASVIVEPTAPVGGSVGSGGGGEAGVGTLPPAAIQFADLTESGSESDEVSTEPPQQPQPEQQGHSPQQQQQQLESDGSPSAEQNTPAARSSPPPNCAICLSRCRRKCFTDSCMHQFCFKCLCEWSKIKPECPLCKQPFKTIIHNVRTLQDYDRYPVQSSTPEHSALSFHIVNIRRQRFMLQNLTNDLNASATDESQDGVNLNAMANRMHVPFNRFEPYRMELLNLYRQDQDTGRGTGSLSQLWRRYVYDRKLYALPVSDSLTGHFREWSARFYRDNPAQMHRLMPWINRDIVCLLRNSTQNVSDVMQLMHNILPMINIPTRTFRRRLSPFLGERTNHFIHELFNFARSPYDMIGYDRVVQYSSRVAEEVEVDLLDLVSNNNDGSSSNSNTAQPPTDANGNGNTNNNNNSNGSSVNNGSNGGNSNVSDLTGSGESSGDWSRLPRPSTSVIVTNPSSTHSFSVTMATDGSELPGISIRRTTTSNVGSQTVAINLSMRRSANEVIEIDDGDAAANAEVAAINDSTNQTGRRQAGASLPISAHIELQSSDCSNSSDDDECVFVLERKPPHLRTPELVSLDSNSDSDVVFVDEQKAKTSPKAAASAAAGDATELGTATEDAAAAGLLSSDMFMGPSTSTGVCSTSGKHWKTVLDEARRQDATRIRTRHSKRNAAARAQQRSQLPVEPNSSSSNNSSATNWTTTNDDDDSNNNLQRETAEVAKHWKKVLEEARRLEATQLRTRHPKRNAAKRAQQRSQLLMEPSSRSSSSATVWTTTNDEDSSSSDDSNWAAMRKKSKKRAARKPKTRKRSANVQAPAKNKSKRRKIQQHQEQQPDPEPIEEPQNLRLDSSSDSSISSSSADESSNDSSDAKQEAIGNNNTNNNNNNRNNNNKNEQQSGSSNSSSSSDDDSIENVMLSKLRAKLKAEPSNEERKPLEHEMTQEDADQEGSAVVKRRRSRSSNSDLSRDSTTMSSTSMAILTSSRPMSMMHEIANSLIELSTVSVANTASNSLYNNQPVDDVLSLIRNNVYMDDSVEDNSNIFDVVTDTVSDAQVESLDANEDSQTTELDVEHDEADEADGEQMNESAGDNDNEDDDENENDTIDNENDNDNDNDDEEDEENNIATDDCEDSVAPDTENSDSDRDATDAY